MKKLQLPTFYPILDTAVAAARGVAIEDLARVLAHARVGIGQFRHKGPYTRAIVEKAAEVGRILRGAGALFVVNDRPDIALLLGADGVHVGQEDLPPAEVRALLDASAAGKALFIGFSTHNERQLREADLEPADYLAIGPIFATSSKQKPDPVVGVEELARLRPLTQKPLVAIGGIDRGNGESVLTAGADSLAAVSDFVGPDVEERLLAWSEVGERGSAGEV